LACFWDTKNAYHKNAYEMPLILYILDNKNAYEMVF
jgi:hypothetical protein